MKYKYLLENYDRIINQIKNPPIIFSNDLVPYLKKKSSESYLIYPVDFKTINKEVKYSVKNPIHNLHPDFGKIKFKPSGNTSTFDIHIPIILQKLNISNNNVKCNWCAKKKSRLYIVKNCEIEDLTHENRFFLYCYQTLKKENERIKKANKERIYNLKSKNKIEQRIHQKQQSLENLAHSLIKEINPENYKYLRHFSDNYNKTDCLKITYIYLEKLHRFIEKEYKNYINVQSNIPYRSLFIKEKEITNKLKNVKSALLNSEINIQLLNIVYEPILKISTINIKEKLTYYDFNYCSEFILEIHKIIENEKITEDALIDCLFYLNFNSLQFFKFLTDTILKNLENSDNNIQKIDCLYLSLKCYNQKQRINTVKYRINLPSVQNQIIHWIEEEIAYLNRSFNLETKHFKLPPENELSTKFISGLSVAQLSCFFGLLLETEIIKHKNQTDIFKFIAQNFKTKNTDNISIDSLKVKYYNVEIGTKKAIREKIMELLALTKH
ncbi:hypothetical protein [Flavobacterium sp. GSA192]|uniref:hypothetical protein n=1 Tax=Flavobacterium sp. GSA192 TaxID=2576304 RepID=UPI00112D074A|nr:hypothetical protein [Flavobacterium sp. GSA192]